MVFGKFLKVLLLICILKTRETWQASLCPESEDCSCSNSKGSLSITCNKGKTFPNLTAIRLLNNATVLTFRGIHIDEKWDFSQLGKFPNFKKITFYRLTNFSVIDWNWFNAGTEEVRVINGASRKYPNITLGVDSRCEMRADLNVTSITLFVNEISTSPRCFPASVKRVLLLQRHGAENWGGPPWISTTDDGDCYELPPEITAFSIRGIHHVSRSTFCHDLIPRNITSMTLSDCSRNSTNSLRHLPPALAHLDVNNCPMTSSRFDPRVTGLTALYLNRDDLSAVPSPLPSTVKSLHLSSNRIEAIGDELKELSQLVDLEMNYNKLRSWPDELPSSLTLISMQHNLLEFLPSHAFVRFGNLSILYLNDNRLLNFPVGVSKTVNMIRLENNQIRTISGDYRYCDGPCSINVRGNPLRCTEYLYQFISWMGINARRLQISGYCRPAIFLPTAEKRDNFFQYIDYYKKELGCEYNIISLTCRNLTTVPKPSPVSLQFVDLSNNHFQVFPDYFYQNQTHITSLNLGFNNLRQIPVGLPVEYLVTLKLNSNRITHISRRNGDDFVRMTRLRTLDLNTNLIKSIEVYDFRGLGGLRDIFFSNNPFNCDCKSFVLEKWFRKYQPKQFRNGVPSTVHFPLCTAPEAVKNQPMFTNWFYYWSNCLYSCAFEIPDLSCSYYPSNQSLFGPWTKAGVVKSLRGLSKILFANGSLTLTNSNWTNSDFSNICRMMFFNVNFSGNHLTEFPVQIFGEFIEVIDLSDNFISHLPQVRHFLNFTRLRFINLANNYIRTIRPKAIPVLKLVRAVSFDGNPLSCECEQRPLMTWIESVRGSLTNGSRIQEMTCWEPEMLRGRKMIDEANEGFDDYCPIREKKRTGLIFAVILASMFIAINGSIVINTYLNKRRQERESRNIILGFKQLLSRETELDDVTNCYKYDAFISYANQDEEFVYSLVEELESKRARKISFHERDFTAGLSIVDNIVECIGNSSRVILVISDHFIQSSWCQYEVLVALASMHQHRRGKFLTPILLQNSVNGAQGNTKVILSEIASIVAPENFDDITWQELCDEVDQSLPIRQPNAINQ